VTCSLEQETKPMRRNSSKSGLITKADKLFFVTVAPFTKKKFTYFYSPTCSDQTI
jgi:hypothetical protein